MKNDITTKDVVLTGALALIATKTVTSIAKGFRNWKFEREMDKLRVEHEARLVRANAVEAKFSETTN